MTCTKCQHAEAKKFGCYGKRRIRRYRCPNCRSTFSEPAPKLGTHSTDLETGANALAMVLERISVRAISRITGLHKGTIYPIADSAQFGCSAILGFTA